ncbi:MAG: hypothetical protein ACK5HP_04830 [Bacilli bacterium]
MENNVTIEDFYAYIIAHPEVTNDLTKLTLIKKYIENNSKNLNSEFASGIEKGKQKIKSTNNKISFEDYKDISKQAGFSNILMLGILTFVSEIMFIIISYLLFK